ncbi:MAG TPA: RNA polymerase sigma factor [Pseudomonadales bacterium]|nr:RNA polymerase sigma factor [Pseudomonadales bacterium]
MPNPTDEELMAQVQRRDQEAFTRLLDRHLAGLRNFLIRTTGNAADADEVAQEAFLRIWSHAKNWQPDRVRFTTWLFRIARNLAIDRHRKHRETNDENLEQVVDDAPDTGHTIDAERRRKMMQNAIAHLPERQRTALVLCHFDGMSNPDAAAVLEITVEALESLLARARRTLKNALRPLLETHETQPCPTTR